jgi:hypothetical protein
MTSEQRNHLKKMESQLNITIKTAPHKEILNKQVGDYQVAENGDITITVADLGNKKMSLLIAIHELVELFMLEDAGITIQQVEDFDAMYEKFRKDDDDSENGDSPFCPYRRMHFAATNIERLLADYLKIDWMDYEQKILDLEY